MPSASTTSITSTTITTRLQVSVKLRSAVTKPNATHLFAYRRPPQKNGIMLGDEHSKKTTPGLGSPITLVLGETGGEHNFVIF